MSRWALVPAAVALAMSGCIATQRDMLDLENQTDELKASVIELKKTVQSMQANQADLSVQMKQLHEDLSAFTEAAQSSHEQMAKLSSKLDDMGVSVASKVESIGSNLAAQAAQQTKAFEEQKVKSEATQPSDLFNAADVRLSVKSFGLAAKGFEDYIAKYPKGALADVAAYKLGQAYFGDRKWEAAGRQYALFLDKYPKSELTPAARLMYALCLVNLKRNLPEARQYLESITIDYPKTPEAKAAAGHLKKLASAKLP